MEFFNLNQLPAVPAAIRYFGETTDRLGFLAPDDDTYKLLHYLDLAQNPKIGQEAVVDSLTARRWGTRQDTESSGHSFDRLRRAMLSSDGRLHTIFSWYRQINGSNVPKIQHHSLLLKLSPPFSEITSFAI